MDNREILQQYLELLSEYTKRSDFDFSLAGTIAEAMLKICTALQKPF